MKSVFILASLCATVTLAKPLDKRWLVTEWDLDTVTVTVTDTVTAYPTTGAGSASSAAAADTTTTTASFDNQVSPAAAESPTPDTNNQGWTDWNSPQWSPTPNVSPTPAPAEDSLTVSTTQFSSPPVAVQTPSTSSQPTPAVSSTSSSAAPIQTSVSSDYQQGILDAHNIHRSNASVPGLTWSDNMASIAQQIASSCVYAHNTQAGGGGYGQNIGAGVKDAQVPALINNLMYNAEIGFYPLPYGIEPDMSNFEKWGHYSQIVWKSTTEVGCYTQDCSGRGLANVGGNTAPFFTVCNYHPPGNFGGQYGANIHAPGGAPTVTL